MNPKLKNLLIYVAIAVFIVGGIYLTTSTTRHYWLKPILMSGQVVYKGDECFVVLNPAVEGKSPTLLAKLIPKKLAYLNFPNFQRSDLIVYHYADQHLQRFELPGTSNIFRLTLTKGSLTFINTYDGTGHPTVGKRWTGKDFVSLTASELRGSDPLRGTTPVEDDDAADESPRDVLQEAGWTQKYIYTSTKDRVIPLRLSNAELKLTEHSIRDMNDLLAGIKGLELAGPGLRDPGEILWAGADWKEVSREEYSVVMKTNGREDVQGLLLVASILSSLIPYVPFLLVIYRVFRMKSQILKTQSKQHTFQPVTQDLFPHLDRVSVDAYSKELESLGFTLQMEFTLVGNASKLMASYARLYTNTQQNMFAEVFQIFVNSKAPRPVSANISTSFTDGWVLTTANTKPVAMLALQRLPRSLSMTLPGKSLRELYERHLQKRNEIAFALGISPLTNTTREAYITRSNSLSAQRYEKLQKSSIFLGMLKVLQRKISPSYEWMGDFKKEAAKRSGGFANAAGAGKL